MQSTVLLIPNQLVAKLCVAPLVRVERFFHEVIHSVPTPHLHFLLVGFQQMSEFICCKHLKPNFVGKFFSILTTHDPFLAI